MELSRVLVGCRSRAVRNAVYKLANMLPEGKRTAEYVAEHRSVVRGLFVGTGLKETTADAYTSLAFNRCLGALKRNGQPALEGNGVALVKAAPAPVAPPVPQTVWRTVAMRKETVERLEALQGKFKGFGVDVTLGQLAEGLIQTGLSKAF